ncbi:MAG: metal-dependent transcriptional regulator [Anaerolineae bacterium]|nr:metal-dependent transcriptional regulator [Anaerolineae bacterium]
MSNSQKSTTGSRPSPTIEDYLAALYVMQRDGENIVAARVAESLEVSAPTVTITLKRMERDGWLSAESKNITLTEAGIQAAQSVIRRHMLTEWMLARMLNVPWSRIHAEAHQIEHTISDEIEAQMRAQLSDPQLCPHGNPLPGYESLSAEWSSLTDVQAGEHIIIRRIHETAEDNAQLLQYLEDNGIIPGAEAIVSEILPFNQTLTLEIKGKKSILGFSAARYIGVDILENIKKTE